MAQPIARYEDMNIMSVDPNMVQMKQKLKGLGTTRPSFNTPFKINLGGVQGALTTENPIATIEPGKKPQVNRQLVQPQQEVAVEETVVDNIDYTQVIGELGATILENPDATVEETKSKFPEFANVDTDVFGELGATIQNNPDISIEEVMQKFPELVGGAMPTQEEGNIVDFIKSGGKKEAAKGDITRIKEGAAGLAESVVGLPRMIYNLKQEGQNAVRNTVADIFGVEGAKVSEEYGKMPSTAELAGVDENSELFKLGEQVGTIAQLPLGAGGARAGVKGAIQLEKQAATNALKTAIDNIGDEAGETIIKNKYVKQFWDTIKPELTPTKWAEAKEAGQVKIIDGVEMLIPKAKDKSFIKTAVEIGITPDARSVDNINAASKAFVNEAESLKQFVIENNKPFNMATIKSRINSIKIPEGIKRIDEAKGIFKDLKDAAIKTIESKDKKLTDRLLQARKDFDTMVEQEYGNIYKDAKFTPLRKSVKEIRDTINNYVGEVTDPNVVKDSLNKQSEIKTLIKNLASQKTKEGENALSVWMRENPKATSILKYLGATALGGGLVGAVFNLGGE